MTQGERKKETGWVYTRYNTQLHTNIEYYQGMYYKNDTYGGAKGCEKEEAVDNGGGSYGVQGKEVQTDHGRRRGCF